MKQHSLVKLAKQFETAGDWFALLFNTGFAITASLTLIGIVFVTRPKQVMHEIPPHWWLPLMLLMVPAQIWCQYISWRTVFLRRVPSPLEIALAQPRPWQIFRFPLAALWAINFLIGFAIVVALYKPDPQNKPDQVELILVGFVAMALTSFANIYLMLAVRTLTSSQPILRAIWSVRHAIDIAIGIAAFVWFKIGH